MKCLLRFECIGDGAPLSPTLQKIGFRGPSRYFVHRLTLTGGRLVEESLKHFKDFTQSNGSGTRGVYAEYILSDGECYHVKQPVTWKRADHFYCTVRNGELVRLTRDEVMKCLASACSE